MRRLTLTAAAMLVSASFATAHQRGQFFGDAGMAPLTDPGQSAGAMAKIAMGPVSAPHLPSGSSERPAGPSGCAETPDSCPPHHKKPKHPRQHPARN